MNSEVEVIRTEQIWIHPNKTLSKLCHLSKNLYNQANYIIKNAEEGKWIRYNELDKILNGKGANSSENYKQLPSCVSQHILMSLDKSWTSFFKAIKVWKKHPDKFQQKPNPPHYKKKNGEHILIFTNEQCKIKGSVLKFPKKVGLEVKTRLSDETNLREVRILPKGVGYVVEIIYKKEVDTEEKDRDRIVGIDLGSKNIITMVNNIGLKPIVVKDDGTGIKSINQFYNKKKAELQSIYDLQGVKDGDKLRRLRAKRDRKANDWIHKLSRYIVDWCVKHEMGTIIVGHNDNWKQRVELGRRNNQNFVLIPFNTIFHKMAYKAEEKGIEVKEQEESHTSKCSFLDNEPIEHQNNYIGKRITRSLFKSAKGIIIHADVNAGYNIAKKANPKAFSNGCEWIGGCGLHPVRCKVDNIIQRDLKRNA